MIFYCLQTTIGADSCTVVFAARHVPRPVALQDGLPLPPQAPQEVGAKDAQCSASPQAQPAQSFSLPRAAFLLELPGKGLSHPSEEPVAQESCWVRVAQAEPITGDVPRAALAGGSAPQYLTAANNPWQRTCSPVSPSAPGGGSLTCWEVSSMPSEARHGSPACEGSGSLQCISWSGRAGLLPPD